MEQAQNQFMLEGEPAPYPGPGEDREEVFVLFTREEFEERLDAQQPYRTEWTQNMLFMAGLQNYEYDRNSGDFRIENLPHWRERPVHNRFKPFAKTFMAKMLKNQPILQCVVHGDDPSDAYAVDLGNDVLRAKWIELSLEKKLKQAIAWIMTTGNAYILPFWNTDSGNLVPLTAPEIADKYDNATGELVGREVVTCPCDDEGKPLLRKDGSLDMEAEPHYIDMGEIGTKVHGPFNVFPNEDAVDDDDVDSWIIAESASIREIRRRWPKAKGIMPEDTTEVDEYNRLISAGLAAGADTHYTGPHFDRSESNPRRALLIHRYEKPSPTFPRGRYWIVCNKTLLEPPQELPSGLWPPVLHMKDIEVEGQYLGEATMTAAVGIQKEINKYAGRIAEHIKLLNNGRILVPRGARVPKGAFNTREGQVIKHTPGMEPKPMEMKALPAQVWSEREFLEDSFQKTTSMHDASQGQQPEGVTAGRAFLVLQEADDADLAPITQSLEALMGKWSWYNLRLMQQYYDEERTIHVAGKSKSYRARAFKGADLTAIVSVEPQRGSAFPWSKTARQAQLLDMLQTNPWLFIDPETGVPDRQQFREAFEIGGDLAVGSGFEVDLAKARREEEAFMGWDGSQETEGSLPQPQLFHDHAVHMRHHRKVMNSGEFEEWPPVNQLALIQHWFAHRVILQQEMQEMMMLQGGGPDTEGGSGPPSSNGPTPPPTTGGGMPPTQGASLHPSEATSNRTGQQRRP